MENNIIITYGKEYLKTHPQSFLKMNSLFKKMGFKEVTVHKGFDEHTLCDELTFSITPETPRKLKTLFRKTASIISKWSDWRGYQNPDEIYKINNFDESEDIEKIIIWGDHLGNYYKKRNLVVFWFPIDHMNLNLGLKDDFLFKMLEELGKEITRIKIIKVDVSKVMRAELIGRFLREIKTSIKSFKDKVDDKLAGVEQNKTAMLSYLSDIRQYKEQIRVLSGSHKTLSQDIEDKIEEIRKLTFVKRVGISSFGIRVDFRKINLEHEGETVELGECYCYLNPNKLEIKNKDFVTYNGDVFHSPHIHFDSICFGDGNTKAYELLAEMKLKELVYFIYLYLKTYNEGDTYITLKSWKHCKANSGKYSDDGEDEDDEDDEDEDEDW